MLKKKKKNFRNAHAFNWKLTRKLFQIQIIITIDRHKRSKVLLIPKPFKGGKLIPTNPDLCWRRSSWIVICAFSCKIYKPATRECRKETKNICSRNDARTFLEDLAG